MTLRSGVAIILTLSGIAFMLLWLTGQFGREDGPAEPDRRPTKRAMPTAPPAPAPIVRQVSKRPTQTTPTTSPPSSAPASAEIQRESAPRAKTLGDLSDRDRHTVQLVHAWTGEPLTGVAAVVRGQKRTADNLGRIQVSAHKYNPADCRVQGYSPIRYSPRSAMCQFANGRYGMPVVPLFQSARLRGVVREFDGRPAAGWKIVVHVPPIDPELDDPDLLRRLRSARWLVDDRLGETTTDEGGQFVLDAVVAGLPIIVTASHPDNRLTSTRQEYRLSSGEDRRVDLRCPERADVEGRVLDQHGLAVQGAYIDLNGAETYTDAAGRFRFANVSCGRLTLTVRGGFRAKGISEDDAFHDQQRQFTLGPGFEGRLHEIRVHRSLFAYGKVLDPQGRPVKGARVLEVPGGPTSGYAHADESGRFRFGPMNPGPTKILAEPGWNLAEPGWNSGLKECRESLPMTVRPGDCGVELILRPQSVIHARVIDSTTGDAAAARVLLLKDGACVEVEDVRSDGEFCSIWLGSGTYGLIAWASRHRFGELRGIRLVEGQALKGLTLTLHNGGTVVVATSHTKPPSARSDDRGRYQVRAYAAGLLIADYEGTIGKRIRFSAPVGEVQIEVSRLGSEARPIRRTVTVPLGQTIEVKQAIP